MSLSNFFFGGFAAAFVAASALPATALPTYVLEDRVNTYQDKGTTPDLTGLGNNDIPTAISSNSAFLGQQVEFIGRIEDNDIIDDNLDTAMSVGGLLLGGISLAVECTQEKEPGDCVGFDWSFDFSGLADSWEIVKIGVKAGNESPNYWLLDPFAADGDDGSLDQVINGTFSCDVFIDGTCPVDLEDLGSGVNAVSHVDFFGVRNRGAVSEPGMLALFGFSLLGLAVASRRRVA